MKDLCETHTDQGSMTRQRRSLYSAVGEIRLPNDDMMMESVKAARTLEAAYDYGSTPMRYFEIV